jgi:hypothetical protein
MVKTYTELCGYSQGEDHAMSGAIGKRGNPQVVSTLAMFISGGVLQRQITESEGA